MVHRTVMGRQGLLRFFCGGTRCHYTPSRFSCTFCTVETASPGVSITLLHRIGDLSYSCRITLLIQWISQCCSSWLSDWLLVLSWTPSIPCTHSASLSGYEKITVVTRSALAFSVQFGNITVLWRAVWLIHHLEVIILALARQKCLSENPWIPEFLSMNVQLRNFTNLLVEKPFAILC